jgi:hypothetical protein
MCIYLYNYRRKGKVEEREREGGRGRERGRERGGGRRRERERERREEKRREGIKRERCYMYSQPILTIPTLFTNQKRRPLTNPFISFQDLFISRCRISLSLCASLKGMSACTSINSARLSVYD